MLNTTRRGADKKIGSYIPTYSVIDFTDVATYFEILNEAVGLYYYDTDTQEYIPVGSATYDPDKTYYTETMGNYYQAPMTPEAYFRYNVNHYFGKTYIKNGDEYEMVDDPDSYDATQTYYTPDEPSANEETIYVVTPSNEGDTCVSSKSTNSLIPTYITSIMLTDPVADTRYGTQLKAPTTDGTYTLKVTIVDGHPTFSWVSDQE